MEQAQSESENIQTPEESKEEASLNPSEANEASQQGAEPPEGPQEPTWEERLTQAESKAEEMKDRYIRLNAEFENFKKRMAKENA